MLTLTRGVGESIRIGDDIEVYVIDVRGGTVRLGFKAPRAVAIHREEVYQQIVEVRALASAVASDAVAAMAAFVPRADGDDPAGDEPAERGPADGDRGSGPAAGDLPAGGPPG